MPKGTRVARCKNKVMKSGKSEGSAIAICQKSTKQSYATGKPLKKKKPMMKKSKGKSRGKKTKY